MLPSLANLGCEKGPPVVRARQEPVGEGETPSKVARLNAADGGSAVHLELGVEEVERLAGVRPHPGVAPLVHTVLALVSFFALNGLREWVSCSEADSPRSMWRRLYALVKRTLEVMPATSKRLGGRECLRVTQQMADDSNHVLADETLAELRGTLDEYLSQRRIPPATRPANATACNHLTLFEEYFNYNHCLAFRSEFNFAVRVYTNATSPATSCVGMVMVQNEGGKGHVRIQGIVACPFFLAARRGGSIVVSIGVGTTIMNFVTGNGKEVRVDPLSSAHAWKERLCGWRVRDLHGERQKLSGWHRKLARLQNQDMGYEKEDEDDDEDDDDEA